MFGGRLAYPACFEGDTRPSQASQCENVLIGCELGATRLSSSVAPLFVAAALAASAGAAFGQADRPSTGSNGTSLSAVPPTHHPQYVARTGKRKPPGHALDEREGMTPALEEEEDARIRQHTLKSICRDAPGCEGGHLWNGRK